MGLSIDRLKVQGNKGTDTVKKTEQTQKQPGINAAEFANASGKPETVSKEELYAEVPFVNPDEFDWTPELPDEAYDQVETGDVLGEITAKHAELNSALDKLTADREKLQQAIEDGTMSKEEIEAETERLDKEAERLINENKALVEREVSIENDWSIMATRGRMEGNDVLGEEAFSPEANAAYEQSDILENFGKQLEEAKKTSEAAKKANDDIDVDTLQQQSMEATFEDNGQVAPKGAEENEKAAAELGEQQEMPEMEAPSYGLEGTMGEEAGISENLEGKSLAELQELDAKLTEDIANKEGEREVVEGAAAEDGQNDAMAAAAGAQQNVPLDRELQSAQDVVTDTDEKIQDTTEEKEATEVQKTETTEEINKTEDAANVTRSEKSNKESQISEIQGKISNIKSVISTIKQTITALKAAIAAAEACGLFGGGGAAAALKAQLRVIEAQLKAVEKGLQATEFTLKAANGDLDIINKDLAGFTSQLANLSEVLGGQETAIGKFTSDLTDMSKQYQEAKETFDKVKDGKLTALMQQIPALQNFQNQVKAKISDVISGKKDDKKDKTTTGSTKADTEVKSNSAANNTNSSASNTNSSSGNNFFTNIRNTVKTGQEQYKAVKGAFNAFRKIGK